MARSDGVHESRLEMEFFPVLKREILSFFGAHRVEILKPTPGREAYVGFDQGFVLGDQAPTISHNAFLRQLGDDLRHGVSTTALFHLAYFLQYKVVERMERRRAPCPAGFVNPHFRAALDLDANPGTGRSQHATLRRLCALPGAEVYYACPMVFDVQKLKVEASLDDLVLANVAESPIDWKDGEEHYLMYQDPAGNPWWCSDPVEGQRVDPKQAWAASERRGPASTTRFLEAARQQTRRAGAAELRTKGGLPESLRLIRVTLDPNVPPVFPEERQ